MVNIRIFKKFTFALWQTESMIPGTKCWTSFQIALSGQKGNKTMLAISV